MVKSSKSVICQLALIISIGSFSECLAATKHDVWRIAPKTVKSPWRALADYPRPPAPDTGWGMHDVTDCIWKPQDAGAFFKDLKARYGISWFKVLACGANKMDVVRAAHRQGVEPVVRLYAPGPHPYFPRPGKEEDDFRNQIRDYCAAGAHYFESGNEPNLGLEWSEGVDNSKELELLCKQWLRVKKLIQEAGGIPVFYAMTPGSAGEWWQKCLDYFKSHGQIEQAFAGAAFGAHLGTVNHPLDYPFDAKTNMPHATDTERYQSLLKDNTCYRAGELIMLMMARYLPSPIPILSTEGGVWVGSHEDIRYPEVTMADHIRMTMEMFNRFNPRNANYWGDPLFAQMCWEYNGYFNNMQYGRLPVLDAMTKAKKFDRGVAFKK